MAIDVTGGKQKGKRSSLRETALQKAVHYIQGTGVPEPMVPFTLMGLSQSKPKKGHAPFFSLSAQSYTNLHWKELIANEKI